MKDRFVVKNNKKFLPGVMIVLLAFLVGCGMGERTAGAVTPKSGNEKIDADVANVTPTKSPETESEKTTTPTSTPSLTPTFTPTPTPEPEKPSLETFLRTVLKPVGSTLYIWGGGWNEEDTGAGTEGRSIGVSHTWHEFFDSQDADYNYKNHDYEIHNGLDCSGYVGWAVYNALEKEDGREGYVCSSTNLAGMLASKGLGEIVPKGEPFWAGDIVSMKGHVYIVLGTCSDGSVLIAHSSPPGVRISGIKNEDGSDSEAVGLAYEFTKNHFAKWFERYDSIEDYGVSASYYDYVERFRWSDTLFEDYHELTGFSVSKLLEKISTVPDWLLSEELSDDTVRTFRLNTGNAGVSADAELSVEHMLRFDSDSRHEAMEGYEWITFNCRISSEDEKAFEFGYNYNPYLGILPDIQHVDDGFLYEFRHINSGVYETENGKKRISDTFSCEVRLPKKAGYYVFGLLDTEENDTGFGGNNILTAFKLSADRAGSIVPSVDELTDTFPGASAVGRYVYYGSMDSDDDGEDEPIVWYVLDEKEDELVLLSRDILFLKDNDDPVMEPEISGLAKLSKDEFTSYLWKKGQGYDTIAAAAPTKKCLEDMISLWGGDSFTELIYYTDYILSEEGLFAGADGVGCFSEGNGSLLELAGVRPCIRIKIN